MATGGSKLNKYNRTIIANMSAQIQTIVQLALLFGLAGDLPADEREARVRWQVAEKGSSLEEMCQKTKQQIEQFKAEAKQKRDWTIGVENHKGNQKPQGDKPYLSLAVKAAWASVECAAANHRILFGPQPVKPASLIVHVIVSGVAARRGKA
jgi:hypothetical protein